MGILDPSKNTVFDGCNMDLRELKGLELAARAKIVQADDGTWQVPAGSVAGVPCPPLWADMSSNSPSNC
jgi:hypothetical protein